MTADQCNNYYYLHYYYVTSHEQQRLSATISLICMLSNVTVLMQVMMLKYVRLLL